MLFSAVVAKGSFLSLPCCFFCLDLNFPAGHADFHLLLFVSGQGKEGVLPADLLMTWKFPWKDQIIKFTLAENLNKY